MAAISPLPSSSSKAAVRGKQRRTVSEFIDPLYYNQLLDELRQQQDAGSAYFGNFVYEPRGVPASLLLPSGTPIFQPNTPLPFSQSGPASVGNHALVFERMASAEVEKDSAAVRFLMEPPANVRSGTLATSPLSAGKRTGTPFKSPAVTGIPADLKPAVDAVKFIEKAKAHYSSLGPDGWKDKLSAQLMQRAAQWADLDLFSTPFSEEEAMLVLVGRFMLGNCWTDVAMFLPGRTGKMVKSFWHSKLRARYHRYGWKGRELSPPPELHKSSQQRPGSAASEGLKVGEQETPGEEAGDDSEDEEPREEARGETNEEALAREHALMQAALAAKDPAAVLRAYHVQYERLQPGLEEQSERTGEWEERCFLCKDGGDLLCCQKGHEGGEGEGKCWKVYHTACLGPKVPRGEDDIWYCPRHACASDRCPEPVQSECSTCPTSYCDLHLPSYLGPQQPEAPGGKMRLVCDRCRELRGEKRKEASAGVSFSDSVAAASERKRRQRQRERDEAKRVELERQKERREKDRRKREEEAEREMLEDADQPEWIQILNGIKHMPTNNGGPIVTRIEKAIGLARGNVHPEVIEQLQLALSGEVYKSNSAGNTRHQALAAVELHKSHEALEKEKLTRS